MSVLSPKRVLFAVVATAVLAANALANNPSPRAYPRMAFDPQAGETILFGGTSPYDKALSSSIDSDETWSWNGTRWVRRYPAHNPSVRAAQAMAYDSARGRILMFGGRQVIGVPTPVGGVEKIRVIADTWIWKDGDWTELSPATSPSKRMLAGMAYDSKMDRMVLYGGVNVDDDGLTTTALYDTWEFDGTTWNQIDNESVKVGRPMLAYDKSRNQMILVGIDSAFKSHTYKLDRATSKWVEIPAEKQPDCVNESSMAYQDHTGTIVLIGGVCSVLTDLSDKTWEWNGTTWTDSPALEVSRGTGTAIAYDSLRFATVIYGGTDALETRPRATTYVYRDRKWKFFLTLARPTGRTLFAFNNDPVTGLVWLVGGLNEYGINYDSDYWTFRDGQWSRPAVKDAPAICDWPVSAYDKDRGKLIVVCGTSSLSFEVFEVEGTTFKNIATTKKKPTARRQAGLVYDETLKKIVLFGGFDGADYKDDTWTWNGTDWTEVTKNKPPNRSMHAMWYDPLAKKTILYGGIGREDIEEHVKRFADMWSFTGTGWTKMTPSGTPGERLGAQYAVDPNTGKVLLFGGLRYEITDPKKDIARQYYDNETWVWDGSAGTWAKLSPEHAPAPRQNGRLVFDPSANRLMLYGGYAGFYFSEVWYWTGSDWQLVPDVGSVRRRSAAPVPQPPPPTGND